MAFAELPEYIEHRRCRELTKYFEKREAIYTNNKKNFVNQDISRFSFPATWRANTWEILYAFSKMGMGNAKFLRKTWEYIESMSETPGFYHIDWIPSQSPWMKGKRDMANKWITFYIHLAKKYREQV